MTDSPPDHDVERAVRVLRDGGIIGLPTETVYGLAALAEDADAVARVFEVKGRPRSHPLIVHLASVAQLDDWGVLDDNAHELARRFMPGPLTLLVPRRSRVPDWVTGGRDTVALRIPNHPVAHALLEAVGTGVVAPSANRFGRVSPTTADHVAADLGDDVDLVLDGGPSAVGVESTIVECAEGRVRILRPGAVTAEQISAVVSVQTGPDDGDSRAPGMMKTHYAPVARVVLVESMTEADSEMNRARSAGLRSALVHHDDVEDYAESLYSDMRSADMAGVDVIVAVLPPEVGLGAAVRDRLMKAAARPEG